jgi:hypothetical protein
MELGLCPNVQPCPKVAFWGILAPGHLELIFWDETWYMSSLGQILDPLFLWSPPVEIQKVAPRF